MAYAWLMWRYIYYWEKLEVWETPLDYIPTTKVTLIIPVRNEAENIAVCLQSILSQNYPAGLIEVIVIDDHSTDQTLQVLNQIKDKRLKIFQLSDFVDSSKEFAFKKKAIEIAIGKASGDLIVTTDGDCIAPQKWLQRMTHLYELKGLKFIAAPVNFHEEKNILEYFQSLDFIGMMGITGAGIRGQFMNMCNGANLAYDKKAFQAVDGFNGIDYLASGDDMLLMQKIAQRFPGKIGYLKNVDATILTKAQSTLSAFYNQRLRWASKSSDYKEWKVTAMLGVVWLFCISIIISMLSISFLGMIGLYVLLGQAFIKVIVDYLLLSRTTQFFNRPELMKYFIPSQVLHIFYIAIVGTLSIFIKKYSWKGRTTQ
jgi:cellulose synthase/poly-beta-1,6-N-acetylglucosamine synthase-like glycosyltransferase